MTKVITKKILPQTKPSRNPWTNLVDFLRRVNAARRSELLLYNKRLSLLSRIAKTINSEVKINKILRLILKGAVNLTNSNTGVIFFRQGKSLRAIESYGLEVAPIDLVIRPKRGIVGHVFLSKKTYLCQNTDKDKYFVPWATAKRAHSELAVPIIIDREVNGVLIVSSRDYDKYSKMDELLLKDLSENASIAIKNAKQNEILAEKVKLALAAKMQFVADVSHELRTPLTVIQGNIELLQRSKNSMVDQDREAMQDVVEESKNIAVKLENLIDLINQGARSEKIELKNFELADLISEVFEITKKLGRQKHLKIILKNNPKIDFCGDREKIKEMLLNLSTNAVKYNQYRGSIWFEVKLKNKNILIEVADTGIGITASDLPFIFDRFWRAQEIEKLKRKSGSGIGLAVSRSYARSHGGEIKVVSKVGAGTKFMVSLPLNHS